MSFLEERKRNILESYKQPDVFEKGGKRAQIGEVRIWGGVKYVKHQEGWVTFNQKTGKGSVYGSDGKKKMDANHSHIGHFVEHTDTKGGGHTVLPDGSMNINKPKDSKKEPSNSPEIGKTKSGKQVYQDGSELEQDEDWTAEDHEDAVEHHRQGIVESKLKSDDEQEKVHREHSSKHLEKMTEKLKRDEIDKKKKKMLINSRGEYTGDSEIKTNFKYGPKMDKRINP